MTEGGLRKKGYHKHLLPGAPLISIITVVYNGDKFLERCINSVIRQTYSNIEYIVIDGRSTDTTLDIIKKYEDKIDYWVCEKDKGISDAFNKGIAISRGEYHLFLNSDDWYEANLVMELVKRISSRNHVVCSNANIFDENGKFIRHHLANPSRLYYKMSLPHNSCLTKTSTVLEFGGYNLSKKIAMDHELMLKILYKHGIEAFTVVDNALLNYSLGGLSDKCILEGFKEVRENIITITNKKFIANLAFLILVAKSTASKSSIISSGMRLYNKLCKNYG